MLKEGNISIFWWLDPITPYSCDFIWATRMNKGFQDMIGFSCKT